MPQTVKTKVLEEATMRMCWLGWLGLVGPDGKWGDGHTDSMVGLIAVLLDGIAVEDRVGLG